MTFEQKLNSTVRQLWRHLTGRKWPAGWRLVWDVAGLTEPLRKTIYLSAPDPREPYDFETLIHELVHLENLTWRHGKYFDRRVREFVRRGRKWASETKRLRLK